MPWAPPVRSPPPNSRPAASASGWSSRPSHSRCSIGRVLASSLVVLSRSVGMVVALSALTAFGLARLQSILVARRCDTLTAGPGSLLDKLTAYEDCLRGALLQEYREIFLVAAGLCGLAALIALATLPSRAARTASSRPARPEAVPE